MTEAKKTSESAKQTCGIVMPISAIDGCGESHWIDVLSIINGAIESAGFEPNLVSNADEVGIIQKRIIQNLYENPIVVCDVSGKNPNVMFELGMRLAFDKPTIIIKDDTTAYTFDTSPIEHLEYPRDLRFSKIVDFKTKLAEKIAATAKRASSDPTFTTFLKNFGEFTVAKLDKKEVSGQEFILEELRMLRMSIRRMERSNYPSDTNDFAFTKDSDIDVCVRDTTSSEIEDYVEKILKGGGINSISRFPVGENHFHISISALSTASKLELEKRINEIIPNGKNKCNILHRRNRRNFIE